MAKSEPVPLPFREKVFTIRIPNIAGYRIHFIFSNDIVKSASKRYDTDEKHLAGASAFHHGTEGGHSWLFFKEDAGCSVTVHECWHAVYAMLKWAGIEIDNNELIAYTMGYVVAMAQLSQTKNDLVILKEKQRCRNKKSSKSKREN